MCEDKSKPSEVAVRFLVDLLSVIRLFLCYNSMGHKLAVCVACL